MKKSQLVDVHANSLRKMGFTGNGLQLFQRWNQNPNTVYIGRPNIYRVKVVKHEKTEWLSVPPKEVDCKWQNPFSLKKYSIPECLQYYREWLLTGKNPITGKIRKEGPLISEITELQGKVLGCWCKDQKWYQLGFCHGDILLEYLK